MLVACTALFLFSSDCLLSAWKSQQQQQTASSTANGKDNHVELEAPVNEHTGLLGGGGDAGTKATRNTVPQPQQLSYPELAYRALGPTGEGMVKTGIALMQVRGRTGVSTSVRLGLPKLLRNPV